MDTDKEQADYYFSLLKSLSKETKFHLVNKLIDSMIEDEEAIQNERECSETISKEEILSGISCGLQEVAEAKRTGRELKSIQDIIDEL